MEKELVTNSGEYASDYEILSDEDVLCCWLLSNDNKTEFLRLMKEKRAERKVELVKLENDVKRLNLSNEQLEIGSRLWLGKAQWPDSTPSEILRLWEEQEGAPPITKSPKVDDEVVWIENTVNIDGEPCSEFETDNYRIAHDKNGNVKRFKRK